MMNKLISNRLIGLIVLLLMLALNANGQTVEERLNALEKHKARVDSAFGWGNPPIVISPDSLKQPVYEGITYIDNNTDCVIYNGSFMFNGKWTNYLNKGGILYMITSDNGLNGWQLAQTSGAPYGSILLVNGAFRGSAHRWWGGLCDSYFYGSTNGISWATMSMDRTQQSGEDRNLLYDNGLYRNYIRVRPKPRTIGYSESNNFTSWTRIVEILKPDASEVNKQFYQMSVIKTDRGYFGLLTVYRIGDNGEDVEQFPPYSSEEHTSDLQLAYSANGKDNWIRLNGKKNFVNRRSDIKQIFGWWSVIGNTAYIYTAESKRRHTDWENAHNTAGNRYFACRYKIELSDLYKYIN